MTKEEIIRQYEPYPNKSDVRIISVMMDEYAKQQCISILEWSAKIGWESYVDEDRWICISQSNEVIDTETLYKRFEEDKNK